MKPIFSTRYFTIFLLVLVTEIAIAVFSFHRFVRGFLGDVLVIPLLYCFLRAFFPIKPFKVLTGVLAFAFAIEMLQFFELSTRLGIHEGILHTVLGATFDTLDFFAFLVGGSCVLLLESIAARR